MTRTTAHDPSLTSTAPTTGHRDRRWTRRIALLSVAAITGGFGVIGAGPTASAADPPFVPVATVPLGLVQTFGVLTPAAVGNAAPEPVTVIRGDVGAGGALTGFPPGLIIGTVYPAATVNPPMADLQAAYNNAAARPAGAALAAVLDGTTAGPGVHTTAAASGTAAGATFTIDGQGHPDAVFIFQVGGALALGANTTMTLVNGAQAKNVFWQVVGAGGIGANTKFVGTLIAGTAVSSGAGSTINGRLTSLTGAVTMSSTQLYSAPPSMSINGGPSASTTTPTPVIAGVTSARSPMTVTVTIDGVTQAPAVTPADDGAWSYQSPLLINGAHTIVASSVDGAGNVGTFTQTLTVDTTPPTVTIDGGANAATNNITPRITGTTDVAAGQTVTITLTRSTPTLTLTRTALVQADQTWNVAPNGLTAGNWTIVANVADPAGNQSTATQVLTIDATAPAVAITSSALTNDPTPTIGGTTETDATVMVTVDGLAVPGVIVTGGLWSATTTAALGDGSHHVSVTATDSVGNTTSPPVTQTLIVDLVAPVIGINPGATDSTNDRTPTIVGTTDVAPGAGVVVSVTIDGAAALTAVVQADGWNVTPSVQLPAGDHTVVATVADPAHNIGTFTQILTIDVDAPSVTIVGGPSRTTTDATPTITGSSADVAVGSPVTVAINGQTLTTTIAPDGTFSVTAATLPNATHFAFVTVTDAAGNVGNANQALTINAVPPTVTYNNGAAASTNDATPLIAGTTNAAVGSTVVVTAAGQTLHATVQPGGTWNVTAANIGNGAVTIVTEITDASGNVGSATQNLTIDSTTPTMITITGGATAATNDDTPMISGTTDAADGRVLTVTVAGQTLTVSASAGTWAVTATHITDGTYPVAASVTSTGGNPGSATQNLTVDTVAPVVVIGGGATVQTTDPTPPISGGGATPGSTVVVTVAGQTLTTTVGADGTWTVTPTSALPAGANPVTVTITDPAGNTGTGTQTVIVVAEATTITFTSGTTAATNDDTPTISGTTNAANGRILTVSVSTQTLTATIAGGAWTVNATHLSDGTYNVTATVSITDGTPASASQTLTVDAVAPAPPVTQPPVTQPPAGPVVADYTSVGPKRVFDTRAGQSPNSLRSVAKQRVGGGYELQVQMTGLAGYVPAAGVGAVSLNVTSTQSNADGFITVYACGTRETVSSVNFPAGGTVANAVITPVSASGTVCFYANQATDIIADINGWFAAGSAFHAIGPKRVFDTRPDNSPDALRAVPKAKLGAARMIEVRVTDLAGYVPTAGVESVSMNVVVTNPEAPGFITVYACGTLAQVSSVNYVAGQTVANAVIAPVSANGTVCLYTMAATDLVVDINGWIAAGSSFHGVDPARILDTRPGESTNALRNVPKSKIGGGAVLQVQVTDLAGYVPGSGVTAVSLNVTATNTEAAGFITVFACATMEEVSSLNFDTGATVANAVLAPVSAGGTICLYANQATDVIVDINGWIGN